MPITLENGFYVSHDLSHVSCIGIETDRLDDCIAIAKCKNFKGVFGNPSFGFGGVNLNFLHNLPRIEAVWFWDVNLKNIDGLYSLSNLQFFGISPTRPSVDFSRFTKLRKVIIEPKAQDRGLGVLKKVELLHIWHYRPKQMNFLAFEFPESISELQINWANIFSLDSLPRLSKLRRLEVHRCRNLEHLGDLGAKFPLLEYLIIDSCGKVPLDEGERVVKDLTNLTHASVKNTKLV